LIEIAKEVSGRKINKSEAYERVKEVLRGEGRSFCERPLGIPQEYCPIEPITSTPAVTMPNKQLITQVMTFCQLLQPRYGLRRFGYDRHITQLFENAMELCKLVQNVNPNSLSNFPKLRSI
uniref:Bromo domain-containing protein n=1 Tax=Nippostrongylus brasiliensis TaxID=27835 RepID=A0A0N4XPN1_NIPBR